MTTKTMTTKTMTTIRIKGMTCDHCVHAVTRALSDVPGIERVVEVSLERGEAVIEGEPDAAAVRNAIAEAGYEAEVLA